MALKSQDFSIGARTKRRFPKGCKTRILASVLSRLLHEIMRKQRILLKIFECSSKYICDCDMRYCPNSRVTDRSARHNGKMCLQGIVLP